MENSILEKEDKYIKDGYKQIYPNDKDIKVTLLNWVSDWVWICSAFQTRKLSLREAFKNKGSKFLDVEYSSKVADVFITEEEAFKFSKARKKDNELNKFFDSYSRIEIKHATSNRLLNSLTFTRYSLGELLKLVNIYRTENTPIKVSAIDYDGNEIDYSEVEKELERLY